jgi:signal transduction histidine kinase
MPGKHICIVTCASFRIEAERIAAAGEFSIVTVASFPGRCGIPPLSWDEVLHEVRLPEQFGTIHIFGGCCLARLGDPPPGLETCRITRFEFCKEMIAGNHVVSRLVASGAHLVTPGWLNEWPGHIAEWGFDRETARDFFAECSRQIVLLDTGIRDETCDELAAFSEFVNRPYSVVPVGLDLMRLRMQLCREQWQGECAANGERQAQLQYSEYAMAFDLLSTLARSVDEREVIQQTLNLYQMLFAATDTAFIRFQDGVPVSVVWNGFDRHGEDEELLYRDALELKSEYGVLQDGSGFLLRVCLGGQTSGVVRITGIIFPQYIDTYLNLALSTIEVCGLALTNATRYRELADKNREVEAAHALLQSTHRQMLEQEKMASIGHLAAGVAHEINNPMGFITSNLGTLQKYAARIMEYLGVVESGGDVGAARSRLKIDYVLNDVGQLIDESLDGAKRVKNIVNDLKNLSRSERAEPVATDLNACMESALNIACNEIKYVADIKRQFAAIPHILCHPEQISQVFINLLTNAGQAIAGHGIITVRTWSVDGCVNVSVSDTGSGIPEEIRAHIFDPFFTTKDVGKGTGLGLSISYDIVQKHGGEITVESETGRGTTFTVRLPVAGQFQSPESS